MLDRVYITKASAARRQIDAAIKMYFAGYDELAIHTVAGAARTLVRDLNKHRGNSVYSETLQRGIILGVQSWLRGQTHPPDVEALFRTLVGSERNRDKWLSLDPQDSTAIATVGMDNFERNEWSKSVGIINFLKHADRDPRAVLRSNGIDNVRRITESCVWYGDLGFPLTSEMKVFNLYCRALPDNPTDIAAHPQSETIRLLAGVSEKKRRQICLRMLRG